MSRRTQQPVQRKSEDEMQRELLDAATQRAAVNSYKMKLELDKENLEEALAFASKMLNEMRTSKLTPGYYYKLYIVISDHLRYLEYYFTEQHRKGISLSYMYERVQWVGQIVPRLYLLITVGSAYIKSRTVSSVKILDDMVHMCKGEQHPTRGLFLRQYLLSLTKDKLPDVNSEYGLEVDKSIAFVLKNFHDTVNLYCRLKDDWSGRDKERFQLRTLIGMNINSLSNLDCVNVERYAAEILPKLIETITKYNDIMAQDYLMQCIISAFPDEYHLATIEILIKSFDVLNKQVAIPQILIMLMDRLSQYAKKNNNGKQENMGELLNHLATYLERIGFNTLPLKDFLEVSNSLLNLHLHHHSEDVEFTKKTLDTVLARLTDVELDQKQSGILEDLLCFTIVDQYVENLGAPLQMESFSALLEKLDYDLRYEIATHIIRRLLSIEYKIDSVELVTALTDVLSPLLVDQKDNSGPSPTLKHLSDATYLKSFYEEQNLVACMLQLFDHPNTDILCKMYLTVRKTLGKGGEFRIAYTLVPLTNCFLKLASRIDMLSEEEVANQQLKMTAEGTFKFTGQILHILSEKKNSQSFQLYLSAATIADHCNVGEWAYNFLSKAFLLYEQASSQDQLSLLQIIIGTLGQIRNLTADNYLTLTTSANKFARTQLLPASKGRALADLSTIYYPLQASPSEYQNAEKAVECLKMAVAAAKSCEDQTEKQHVFIHILTSMIYQAKHNNTSLEAKMANSLFNMIVKELSAKENDASQQDSSTLFGDDDDEDDEAFMNVIATTKPVVNNKEKATYLLEPASMFEATRAYMARLKAEKESNDFFSALTV
mmetsp:Transcript_5382/g.7931  ORF Transcript_5382/g.7931 Transcript_5382/m.7931 type:complete len:829 (+) Transcript_5382:38-2524(+)